MGDRGIIPCKGIITPTRSRFSPVGGAAGSPCMPKPSRIADCRIANLKTKTENRKDKPK